MEATFLRFATAARCLGDQARRHGLTVPAFRSPPRNPGVDRALSRSPGGSVSVVVRLRGRPWSAVLTDMVEGVVAANRLQGAGAEGARRTLWAGLRADGQLPPEGREAGRDRPFRRRGAAGDREAA